MSLKKRKVNNCKRDHHVCVTYYVLCPRRIVFSPVVLGFELETYVHKKSKSPRVPLYPLFVNTHGQVFPFREPINVTLGLIGEKSTLC